MLNIRNASIISADDVAGDFPAFGPTNPEPGTPMSGDHPAGCTSCSGTCWGECSGDCKGGCGDASCENQCTLECESSCSISCTSTCGEDCTGGCGDTCLSSCKESCQGGCSGGCEGCTGCAGGCIDSCANGCKHSCISMATTAGTHTFTPNWPESWTEDMQHIDTDMLIDILNEIKASIDKIARYDYRRISELDEAVLVHDADTLVGAIVHTAAEATGTTVEDVGEIDLNDLNLVVSDFDNRTVRITAAALVDFVENNYRNYWVWLPKVVEGSGGSNTKLTWEFTNDNHPGEIDLTDVLVDGIDQAIEDELAKKDLVARSFITGLDSEGDPVPLGAHVLRLAGGTGIDPKDVVNSTFLNDLDGRYAAYGSYLSPSEAAETYETKAHASSTYETQSNASSTYETKSDHSSDMTNLQTAINSKLDSSTAASTYETKSHASSTYETSAHASDTYLTKSDASDTYAAKSDVPTQIADDTHNGWMSSSHVVELTTATTDITNIKNTLSGLPSDFTGVITDTDYAYIDNLNVAHPGIVAIPEASGLSVGANGIIGIKDYTVNNLIRNSTFEDGFNTHWTSTSLDESLSTVYYDSTIYRNMARITLGADGRLVQTFSSNSKNGFTVGILFKQDSLTDKVINIAVDNKPWVSYTIPRGNDYVIGEFYFDVTDDADFFSHSVTLRNPDLSNTVSYDLTEIMVQKGRQFTGWNKNGYDTATANSVTIVSYNNNITFKDAIETYLSDVYDETGTVVIHHAGDQIEPSSSIIMHKDKQYFYAHITAVGEIDGQIRQDVIPLRINLLTGKCDISGNAVSAGTLIDNTGELVPSVAELNAFVNGNALDFTDIANEIPIASFPTAGEEYMGKVYLYTGETGGGFTQDHIYHCVYDDYNEYYSWEEFSDYQKKYKYSLSKTVNNIVTELASAAHVGRFATDDNAEIFNDYENNVATTDFAHVEGSNNSATQSADYVHIEGQHNTASGGASCTHIEGYANTASDGASYSHIEGDNNSASAGANHVHIEGYENISNNLSANSHVQGKHNTNMLAYSHLEGYDNIAGYYSNHNHNTTMPNGNNLFRSVIVDALPEIANTYNDEIYLVYDATNRVYNAWDVNWSTGEGVWETAGTTVLAPTGSYNHTEGMYNLNSGTNVHMEGSRNILKTSCNDAHVEGKNNILYEGSNYTHVEGRDNVLYNGVNDSHFEGLNNRSGYTGNGSGLNVIHMEGQLNIASSGMSNTHMEGYNNAIQLSGGNTAHIEGYMNTPAQTNYSHIEGYKNSTTGSNYIVHVSGALNTVNGGHVGIHVEGKSNVVPYGKSSINASTDAITGSDVGGHIEGVGNSLELNPSASSMGVGSGYHIEGSANIITYKDHSNNVVNSGSTLTSYDHIEGYNNRLATKNGKGKYHIEGSSNWASGESSHVEGGSNKGYNLACSHVEGSYNTVSSASGTNSTLYGIHVEGQSNNVYGISNGSHVEGGGNTIYSDNHTSCIHVEGTSHIIGSPTVNVSADSLHIEGSSGKIDPSVTSAINIHIEGSSNKITKINNLGNASVSCSHVEGKDNKVNANYSHVEGYQNEEHGDGYYNHVEGSRNVSHGQYSHTEGIDNKMYGTIGHIEGQYNEIGAYDSTNHRVTSYANHSHVEGNYNTSLNSLNHIEGGYNTGHGVYEHIEGEYNEVYSNASHTSGIKNINRTDFSTVIGIANEPDTVYDTISIIPSDVIVEDNRRISTEQSTYGNLVVDSTLGVTDFIELPYSPIGYHFIGTNAANGSIALYDENKDCLTVIGISDTGSVDTDIIPSTYNREAVYIRLCAVISSSSLNDAELYIMKEPHLFTVGNGDVDGITVNTRSNIVEVSYNKININGDIYQNGELFKSGTPHFVGTSIEWAALTSEEKAAYEGGDIVFTDDNAGSGIVDQVVTPDSPNPVSGGAVYTAMTNMSSPMTSRSTNGYYTGRKYYDGRTTVHYRRKFTSTSLTANAATRVVLGDWDGIDSSFNTIITNAFSNNNNVTYMTIIKDAMDAHICQINCISDSSNEHVAYIACIGTGNYTGEFTIDICIDSY